MGIPDGSQHDNRPGRIDVFHRDGLVFDVTDEGPLDGDVVVLLHGFPTDRTCWGRVTAALNTAGLRTLAPDQRGYSPSARPAGRAAYRLEELVADVVALIDATGRKQVHLVGHDWGGSLAWLVAGNHPDRVATLTAVSTPHPGALARAWRSGTDQRRRSWYIAAFQVPHQQRGLTVTTPGFVRRAHAAGHQVHVWTIDDPAEMTTLLDRGVDGIFTDRTDLLKDVLQGRGQWWSAQGGTSA